LEIFYSLLAILGLSVGSFLNVVVYRVPRGLSVIAPGSQCPACERPIRAKHNIPVLGWVVLAGKCADCGGRISCRYPLVELTTGTVFVVLALRMNELDLLSALPAYLYSAAIGVALSLIDLDFHRLPSAIILPSYPVVAILLVVSSAWRDDWWSLARAGAGAAALLGFYLLVRFIHPAGMGPGDVRLAGILGALLAYLSWPALVIGAFGAFLFGAVTGIITIASSRGSRKTALPFGPFMVTAAFLALFAAQPITHAYLDLLAT
jgi:leader peptidase (prepilin peptidase)/N-methyltransferase